MLDVDVGTFYFNKNSIHAKNEHCYIINDKPSILDQLHVDVPFKKRQKYVLFASTFFPMEIP
jgi:hypothetical protein